MHTIGPFAYKENEILAPDGEMIGCAYQMDHAERLKNYCEETLDNAQLFAAAWEMLEALKALDPGEAAHVTHDVSVACSTCMGRRAIAKAGGR